MEVPVSFEFTNKHIEPLKTALLAAYANRSLLDEMTLTRLDVSIDEIAPDRTHSETVFELIKWAKREGRAPELINKAYAGKPRNPELRAFIEGLSVAANAAPRPAYELMRISEFDLRTTLEDAHLALAGTSGVVGIGVPCEELEFFEHFCKRLHTKLGSKIAAKTQYPLGPPYSSVAEAVEAFGDYKITLKKQDVLCPVQIIAGETKDADTLVSGFWQGVTQQYESLTERRLMLILVGPCDLTFPPGVIALEPVCFSAKHIYSYVLDVVGHLQWSENIAVTWRDSTLAYARRNGVIRMRRVYEHLERTLESLRENVDQEQFQALLQEGI